ncbi:MAG: DUF2478 domain-containing protein [Pseudomonadota bacterium]|nr:DUF2478 domain-containing protein [Pseudomonadota bacterium]
MLRDISDGTLVRILQELGRDTRGCRLDPGALAEAARRVESAIGAGADLLLLNRFGKAEASGAGLRSVVERAILVGVPVLTAVHSGYVDAWNDFHGRMATWLPADPRPVLAWCRAALGLTPAPADGANMAVPASW